MYIYAFTTLKPFRTADMLFFHGLISRCGMFGERPVLGNACEVQFQHSSREAVCFL